MNTKNTADFLVQYKEGSIKCECVWAGDVWACVRVSVSVWACERVRVWAYERVSDWLIDWLIGW